MSTWNMPPGVSTNDIPGNRPEDDEEAPMSKIHDTKAYLDPKRPTFAQLVDGARGTVVFGAGVPALTGFVEATGADHLILENQGIAYAIPLASVVYFRYEGGHGS